MEFFVDNFLIKINKPGRSPNGRAYFYNII